MTPRWFVFALIPLIITPACVPVTQIVQKDHVQTVTIHTEPPGATLWQRVDGDAIELGQAPVVLQGGYSVLHQQTDPGPCALNGAAEGLALGNDVGGKAGGIIGLFGLVAGAAAGAAACKASDGPVETHASQIALVATKPGYLAARHVIQIPRASPILTLRLIPDPNASPAEAQPAPEEPHQTAREPARAPALPEQVEAPPSEYFGYKGGLAITPIQIETRGAELSGDVGDRLTRHLATALDRVGFAGPDAEDGSSQVLETRLLVIGELCILSATLYRTEDRKALRVASARGACDLTALDASIDRLAAQLSPDGGKVLAGP